MRPRFMLATAILLASAACGGGGGDAIFSGPTPVPGAGPSTNAAMNPANWEIGPIINGTNHSKGVALHPTWHPDGWAFAMPQPSVLAGHVGYVTMPSGSLAGKSRIVMRFRLEAEPDVQYLPKCCPQLRASVTAYFQRAGDDWSARGEYETYRWFATFATAYPLESREYEIVAPLDGNWTATMTSSAQSNPRAFAEAKANAARVGFTFGGGDGYGHGVYATGPAKFVLTDFRIE